MPTKLFLGFTMALYLLGFSIVQAQVVINEFVSDPDSGTEWIELLNSSSSETDLSGWSWTDLASPGTDGEHESSPRSLSGTIPAGGFFVFEMSSVLNNTGDSVGLYNGASLASRVTFGKVNNYSKDLEVPAKGKSGALVSGRWETNQEPTKGAGNPSSDSANNTDSNNNNSSQASSSTSSTSSSKNTTVAATAVPAKIKTEVLVRQIAYVGVPLAFQGKMTQGGKAMSHGRYFWNFGDGDFREVKVMNLDKFAHTYYYPGDYKVIFEYYPDQFADVPEASETINIKVIDPRISIARVGDATDFFVELSNNTNYDVDLAGWTLMGSGATFTIPRNTIISANKKMIISGRTSGFTISDLSALKLATPTGEIVFEYSPYVARANTKPPKSPLSGGYSGTGASPDKGRMGGVDNQEALVASAKTFNTDDTNTFSSLVWPVIFLVLIGGAAYGVYCIRRKPTSVSLSQEFEIMDE